MPPIAAASFGAERKPAPFVIAGPLAVEIDFRHRMPVRRLYLCSSYTHPGSGVHGMCGYNAARIALRDLGA